MAEQKPLTWQELRRLNDFTRLEVYARGTGLWIPATLRHWNGGLCVHPDDLDGQGSLSIHEVRIDDDTDDDLKARLVLLVRHPHSGQYQVEDGPYRGLLETLSEGILGLFHEAQLRDVGTPSLSYRQVKSTVRHLFRSGGFMADLWSVFKQVAKAQLGGSEDDPLYRILKDIERGEKS